MKRIFNVNMYKRGKERKMERKNGTVRAMSLTSSPTMLSLFSICMLCLKNFACTVPEKTMIQIYSEKTKWTNKVKNKSHEPILNPMIQPLIVHMYTKFQGSSFSCS